MRKVFVFLFLGIFLSSIFSIGLVSSDTPNTINLNNLNLGTGVLSNLYSAWAAGNVNTGFAKIMSFM